MAEEAGQIRDERQGTRVRVSGPVRAGTRPRFSPLAYRDPHELTEPGPVPVLLWLHCITQRALPHVARGREEEEGLTEPEWKPVWFFVQDQYVCRPPVRDQFGFVKINNINVIDPPKYVYFPVLFTLQSNLYLGLK